MSGPENIIGIGVELNGEQAAADGLGIVGDGLKVVKDEAVGASEGVDKFEGSIGKLSSTLKVGDRNITVYADDMAALRGEMAGVVTETNAATDATLRSAAANDKLAISAERVMASEEAMAAKQAELAINTEAANAALGKTYVGMS